MKIHREIQHPLLPLAVLCATASLGLGMFYQTEKVREGTTVPTATIIIQKNGFSASGPVTPGTEVTWINEDSVPHTVTANTGEPIFRSESLAPGASFTYRFSEAGEYGFFDELNPEMRGSLHVVQPSAALAE